MGPSRGPLPLGLRPNARTPASRRLPGPLARDINLFVRAGARYRHHAHHQLALLVLRATGALLLVHGCKGWMSSLPPPHMDDAVVGEHDTLLLKTTQRRRPTCTPPMLKLALLGMFLTTCALASRYFNIEKLEALLQQIKDDPSGSFSIFLICFAMGIVLMLPGMVLSIGAGAVYGFLLGCIVTWMATVLGQSLSFLLGRYLLRDFVVQYLIKKVPNFTAIEEAMSREGWKLVCLLRLSPLMPYNLLNYVLSVTAIDFWSFAMPSALAITPYVCAFVYIGSMSSSIVDVMRGSPSSTSSSVSITWLAVTAVMFIVTGVFAVLISKRALLTALKEQDRGGTSLNGSSAGPAEQDGYSLTLQSSETLALHA